MHTQTKTKFFLIVRILALVIFSSPLPLIAQQTQTAVASSAATGALQAPTHAAAQAGSLPLCPTGKEYDAGLCYPKCSAGYYGIGPVCWHPCPDGYTDDGALCRKDVIIQAKASYGRGAGTPLTCGSDEDQNGALCYPKCQAGYYGVGPVCWQSCPAGYTDDGVTCRLDPYSFAKDSYGRGVGTLPDISGNCPSDREKQAGLCYSLCKDGYYGVGPVCWQACPAGFTDDGAFCRRPGNIIAKGSYGRGAGVVLHACPAGSEQNGGLCYPVCQAGYSGIGPVCWQSCPAGFTDDGAVCRKDAIIVAKQSYGRGVGAVPNCDINNLDCSGNFEVYSSFRPQPWGYNFANWGGTKYDNSTDLDTATLIRMFGPGVCQTGSTAADCMLKASARDWRTGQLTSADGGHCYGLAVTSQMFFGKFDQPAVYQSTAANTYALDPLPAVRAHITEMFTTQGLSLADGTDSGWTTGKTPSETLALIRANLSGTPNDPYVLGLFKTDSNGKVTAGHAVTPFAIENRGNNVYWVHIYDNNWPNADRYIVIDVGNDTWLYGFGSTNPAEPSDAWMGDAKTKTFQLRLTSAHKLGGWSCPFCNQPGAASAQAAHSGAALAAPQIQFTLSGGGDLLVRDAQNHGVGWDPSAKTYISQIPGATRTFILGGAAGAGGAVNTQLKLPLTTPTTPYSVSVSGDGLTHTALIRLSLFGPGFTMNVSDVTLTPGMHLVMTFQPDGHQLTFNADATGTFTPTITLANDMSTAKNSYLFDLSGITLAPSKTVTVSLDADTTSLHFMDNTAQTNSYKVELLRITPQGQEQRFMSDKAVVSGGSEAAVNFGAWDGKSPMPFTAGGQAEPLKNQVQVSHTVFLPLVVKP